MCNKALGDGVIKRRSTFGFVSYEPFILVTPSPRALLTFI